MNVANLFRGPGPYLMVVIRPTTDDERQRLNDALALDEPVTLPLRGMIQGDMTGVVVGTVYLRGSEERCYEFRIPKVAVDAQQRYTET